MEVASAVIGEILGNMKTFYMFVPINWGSSGSGYNQNSDFLRETEWLIKNNETGETAIY